MTPLSFDISERYELGEHAWSWRLKDQKIRFRGAGKYSQLVSQRIPASESQVDSIIQAFDLLSVWRWRSDYHPQDVDVEVCDGSSWTFNVAFNGKTNRAAGSNAYPSFADPVDTSLSRDRFDLLVAAIYSTFNIDYYIKQARPLSTPTFRHGDEECDHTGAAEIAVPLIGDRLVPSPTICCPLLISDFNSPS